MYRPRPIRESKQELRDQISTFDYSIEIKYYKHDLNQLEKYKGVLDCYNPFYKDHNQLKKHMEIKDQLDLKKDIKKLSIQELRSLLSRLKANEKNQIIAFYNPHNNKYDFLNLQDLKGLNYD